MQNSPSSQNITAKLVIMMLFILIDIVINSFVQVTFSLNANSNHKIILYFIPIQIVITFLIIIMMFIMLWQTFPLRYGLIKTLFMEFFYTFMIALLFFVLTIGQRTYRLVQGFQQKSNFTQIALWNQTSYRYLYFARFLTYPIFYAIMINFCMQIVKPTFYKPSRWLN